MDLAKRVVDKMMSNDSFSRWLGIEVIEIKQGYCKLQMRVREEMTNGFNIAHGGISYSLADSALAFASNSFGLQSVSVSTSISYIKKVNREDVLTAIATEISKNEKTRSYNIIVTNQDMDQVADFNGTVYCTQKEWFPKQKR